MVAEDAEEAIRALDAHFNEAWSKDALGPMVETCYAADALLLPPESPEVRGREAILAFYERWRREGVQTFHAFTEPIVVLGLAAHGVGAYEAVLEGDEGSVRVNGKSLRVYHRGKDGSWRIVADMFDRTKPRPTAGPQEGAATKTH